MKHNPVASLFERWWLKSISGTNDNVFSLQEGDSYVGCTISVPVLPVGEFSLAGHVSQCFGETGDRNTWRSPLCESGTLNAEANTRLCVAQELFGCEGRSASAL